MTLEAIVGLIFAGAFGMVQYLFKNAHQKMERRIEKLEDGRDAYMKKDDFKEFKVELFSRLDKIDKKLETHETSKLAG